uniref:Uncharacterized protein n=1 Tax=viral metagenome TaxID=1070528 RepID=A0A6C0IGA0_9ZZZZ
MERKIDSHEKLNSVSLEDEKDKTEFTENLVNHEIKEKQKNNCLKNFVKFICCKIK